MDNFVSLASVATDFFSKGTFDFREFLITVLSLLGISPADIEKMIPSLDIIIKSVQKSVHTLLIVLIVFAALLVLYYIFNSIVWYKIAKKNGVQHAWLAWIPVLNVYAKTESATAYSAFKFLGKRRIKHLWIVLLALPVCSGIVSTAFGFFEGMEIIGVFFVAIGSLCALLLSLSAIVLTFCYLYKLYSMYVGDKTATIYALISLIGITVPFFVLSILKKNRINKGIDFTF